MFLSKLRKSFVNAGRGLAHVFKSEQNFRMQAGVGLVVLIAAVWLPLQTWERIVITLLVLLVLLMEILNTVLEYLIDLLKPRLHHYVHVIKDVMAGAVLLTALIALAVGVVIFYPYLVK